MNLACMVSGDLGLVLRYINKSVYAFEIILVVVCTYCSVSIVAVKNCVYALEINIVVYNSEAMLCDGCTRWQLRVCGTGMSNMLYRFSMLI